MFQVLCNPEACDLYRFVLYTAYIIIPKGALLTIGLKLGDMKVRVTFICAKRSVTLVKV